MSSSLYDKAKSRMESTRAFGEKSYSEHGGKGFLVICVVLVVYLIWLSAVTYQLRSKGTIAGFTDSTCSNMVYNPWAARPLQSRTDGGGGTQAGENVWGQTGSCGSQDVEYSNTAYTRPEQFLGNVEQPIFYDIGDSDQETTYFYNSAGGGPSKPIVVAAPSSMEGMRMKNVSGWSEGAGRFQSALNPSVKGY